MAPLGDEKPADGKEEEGIPREKAKSKVQKKKKQQQDQWGRRDVPAEHKHEKGGHQQHGGADGAGKNVRGARQRTREKLDAASKKRCQTPDWRAFMRDVHMVEMEEHRKLMSSLPELERKRSVSPPAMRLRWKTHRTSVSPTNRGRESNMGGGGRLASNEIDEDDDGGAISLKFQGEASMQSLPKIPSASPARPKTSVCGALLEDYLDPIKRLQNANSLICEPGGLEKRPAGGRISAIGRSKSVESQQFGSEDDEDGEVGLLDVLGGARDDESHVLRNKKPIPEMFFDDLVEYQPGLFMRNERGIAQVRGGQDLQFSPETLDHGLALRKASTLCKMINLKKKIKEAEKTKGQTVSDAPRERSLSNVNFVSVNKASASEARKEIVRARMIHHAVTRAQKMLEVQEVAMVTEVAWRKKVENDLTVRQDRQKTRLLQTRWLPVFYVHAALMKMRAIIDAGFQIREDKAKMLNATLIIQRAIRRRIRRKYALMLGPSSLYALKYRVRRWVKKAGKAIEERSADIIKKYLMEMRASNRLLTIVKVFTRKVVMCQRYVRAFLQGQRTRKVHMHNLWDEVTKDVIGGSEKNAWMYRVLEKSNAKSEMCSKELRNMRAVFMHELRFHKNSIKAFQSKLEAFELVKDMGMDEDFIKERLGISLMPRLPLYPLVCNRKIMRKHVEDAVEACGIEEFVNVNLKEDLKERIDALVTEMQDKVAKRLLHNESARYIFTTIDTDGSGMLEEEEIHRLLDSLSIDATFHESRGLFQRLDMDSSGSISYPEFVDRIMNWRVDKSDAEAHFTEIYEKKRANKKKKLLARWGISENSDYAQVMREAEAKRAGHGAGIHRVGSAEVKRKPSLVGPDAFYRSHSTEVPDHEKLQKNIVDPSHGGSSGRKSPLGGGSNRASRIPSPKKAPGSSSGKRNLLPI